jgi:hypothetical protein
MSSGAPTPVPTTAPRNPNACENCGADTEETREEHIPARTVRWCVAEEACEDRRLERMDRQLDAAKLAAAPLSTASEPTPPLDALLNRLVTCAHDLPLCSSAVERGTVTGHIAAARTAIEAHVEGLNDTIGYQAGCLKMVRAHRDAAGELLTELRSTLSQVEGERLVESCEANAVLERVTNERDAAQANEAQLWEQLQHAKNETFGLAARVAALTEENLVMLRELAAIFDGSKWADKLAALGSHDGGARQP